MWHLFKIFLSFAFSGVFLYLAFQKVDISAFWQSLKLVHPGIVIASSLLAVLSIAIRAWRWRILLQPVKQISYRTTFTYTMIGFMANNILPAHAGELVRPYLLGKREKVSGFATLATVVVERLLDGMGMILLFLIILPFSPMPQWVQTSTMWVGSFLLCCMVLALALANPQNFIRRKLLSGIEKLPEKVRHKIGDKIQMFLFGLSVFRDRKNLFKLMGLSVLVWLEMAATVLVVLLGFNFGSFAGFTELSIASVVTIIVLAFAVSLPSSPGYVGITQLSFVFTLGLFGYPEAEAVGASVIFNLTQYFPITIFGIILFLKEGLSFRLLKSDLSSP
jgi:hypothetical protein